MYLHNDVSYRSGSISTPIVYSGNLIPQDAVIEANTVWNDFNHDLIVANTANGIADLFAVNKTLFGK